jgi:hypothetical protein
MYGSINMEKISLVKVENPKKKRKRRIVVIICGCLMLALIIHYLIIHSASYALKRAVVDGNYYFKDLKIRDFKRNNWDNSVYVRASIDPEKAKEMVNNVVLKTCRESTLDCIDPSWTRAKKFDDDGELIKVSDDECMKAGYGSFNETLCVNTETGELTYSYYRF